MFPSPRIACAAAIILLMLGKDQLSFASCERVIKNDAGASKRKQVFFVLGQSAMGKASFIRKMLDPANAQLKQRFGIASEDSVEGYGWNLPIRDNRLMWRSNADVIFHKWQYKTHDLIAKFVKDHPHFDHRVIVIWRPFDKALDGWHSRQMQLNGKITHPQKLETWINDWPNFVKHVDDLRSLGLEVLVVSGETYEHFNIPLNQLPSVYSTGSLTEANL